MNKKIYIILFGILFLVIGGILYFTKKDLSTIKVLSFYKLNGVDDDLYLVEYEKDDNANKYNIEIIDNNNKVIYNGRTSKDLLVFKSDKLNENEKYKVKVCNDSSCDEKSYDKVDNFINNDYVCTNILDSSSYNEEISNKIISTSKEYLGIPFILFASIKDPNATVPKEKYAGIDCCTFANAVYESVLNKTVGKKPGHMALETRDKCVLVEDAMPGDMVFWIDLNNTMEFTKYGRVFHIGIYVGNDRVIEATRNSDYGYTGVTYSDLYRLRGNTFLAMITRPYA